NRLRASTANLGPIYWTATGTGELAVAAGTVPASGGTLRVNRPGAPIDGLSITIPSNGFSSPIDLEVRYGDTTGMPRRPGLAWASPPISIASNQAGYGGAMTIRVPTRFRPGQIPFGVFYDRASGAMDIVPAVPIDTTAAIIVTRHLSTDNLRSGGASTLRLPDKAVVQLAIGVANYADLAQDVSTTYDPDVDNWEFAYTPAGADFANAFTPSNLRVGYAVTALSFWRTHKEQHVHLKGRYAETPQAVLSNPRGIKASAAVANLLAEPAFIDYTAALGAAIPRGSTLTIDSLIYIGVKASLYLTGQPVILFGMKEGSETAPAISFIITAALRDRLLGTLGTTDPTIIYNGILYYNSGIFGTPTIGYYNAATDQSSPQLTLNQWVFGGQSAAVPLPQVDALWPQVENNTIGDGRWPEVRFEVTGDARISRDTAYSWSTNNKMWAVCSTCVEGYSPTPPVSTSGKIAGWQPWTNGPSGWTPTFDGAKVVLGKGVGLNYRKGEVRSYAAMFFAAPSITDYPSYLDWKHFVVKNISLDVTTNRPQPDVGQTFTLSAAYSEPAPADPRYEWDLGDGRPHPVTSEPSLETSYPPGTAPGPKTIKVTLTSGGVVQCAGTLTVVIPSPAFAAWRIEVASLTTDFGAPTADEVNAIGNQGAFIDAYRDYQTDKRYLTNTPTDFVIMHLSQGMSVAGIPFERGLYAERSAPKDDAQIALGATYSYLFGLQSRQEGSGSWDNRYSDGGLPDGGGAAAQFKGSNVHLSGATFSVVGSEIQGQLYYRYRIFPPGASGSTPAKYEWTMAWNVRAKRVR
ncbi:MAG: hypothetical protein R2882_11680, partial [Gemmatimonadales bacterium]